MTNKKILTTVDRCLSRYIRDDFIRGQVNDWIPVEIEFHINDLILAIWTVHTKRLWDPTDREKYEDACAILTVINNGLNFSLKIEQIKEDLGSEVLTDYSADIWVWMSVVIAQKLLDLDSSTINRIKWSGKRPDWKWIIAQESKLIIVEAKGTTDCFSLQKQKKMQW